jgi:hypothetical protein
MLQPGHINNGRGTGDIQSVLRGLVPSPNPVLRIAGLATITTDPSTVPLVLLITSAAFFFRVSELACTPAVSARARSTVSQMLVR